MIKKKLLILSDSKLISGLFTYYLQNDPEIIVCATINDCVGLDTALKIINYNCVLLIATEFFFLKNVITCIRKKECDLECLILSVNSLNQFKKNKTLRKSNTVLFDLNVKHTLILKELKNTLSPEKKTTPVRMVLSKRETEIIQLISNGKTTKEIARHLFLSEKTVENHRGNILRKTNSPNMIALINNLNRLGSF